jgi:hypothetical protein
MLTFPRRALTVLALALGLAATTGCSTTYQPARAAGFEMDAPAQIDDEDIRKAFEARPQLPGQFRIAYYTFDPAIAKDLDASLAAVPGVTHVYRIPPLLASGQRRIEEGNAWAAPREVTVKKLRLLAARAHADALVVVDHGYRTGGVNVLSALNVLVIPMLFTPFLDNTVTGYAEAYLIDTRNGYLYGHVAEEDKRGEQYATIYAKSTRELADEQWATLRADMQKDLSRLVAGELARGKEPKGVAELAPRKR